MKNRKDLLGKIIPAITMGIGAVSMGFGVYHLAKDDIKNGNFEISLGAMIITFSRGFCVGKEYGKKINQENYQTKPGDYK